MKRKPYIIALVGLVALALIGGVIAYWSQTSTVENPFDTSKYGSTVREDFKPSEGEDWQPGVEVGKEVTAINTGDTDLIVRMRLDETWVRKSNATADAGVKYKDSANDPYDVYTTSQADPLDGLTALDKSVVTKTLSSSTNWINGGDGWYYYKVNLKGGQTTDAWLESVTLLANADMGKMETKKYVSVSTGTDETLWVWVGYTGAMPKYLNAAGQPCDATDVGAQMVLHNKVETKYEQAGGKDLLGYSQSDYTLTVTMQTVQATQAALNAVFGNGSTFTVPSGTAWTVKP